MSGSPEAARARRSEIAGNLAEVRGRIAAACARAGRDPAEVTLIAVTKTFPADDLVHLAALGVRDVGENREQEARAKHRAGAGLGLRWHFVGQLQTNKAARVSRYIDVVHSVDRPQLVAALAGGAERAGRMLEVFLQVRLDAAPGRGGAAPADLSDLASAVAETGRLRLAGVMAVAPHGEPAEPAFARLREISAALQDDHPAATAISAGMSGDFEAALAWGATHIRLGTALLGRRAAQVG